MRHRAFTLLEIVIVIAVITVLALLLFSIFSRISENARQNNCLSNLRQVSQAMRMYAQDNTRLAPGTGDWWSWYRYYPYAKSTKVFECPEATPEQSALYWPRWIAPGKCFLPKASTVVAWCSVHALNGGILEFRSSPTGNYIEGPLLTTRWDGSAELVQGSQTRQWMWTYEKGHWYPQLPISATQTVVSKDTRFPGEEWPLQWK